MNRIRLLYLRWREEWLLAQVLNGESLVREYQAQTAAARRELERVQRQQMLEVPAQRVLKQAA